MATLQLGTVVRHIRSLTIDATTGEHTDAVLLGAFLRHNDHAAFEVLVRRHGPMILRVCRRALGDVHDAEDALQATFLVLARQAASIRKKTSLASWLHGVACRIALRARRSAFRRQKHEAYAMPSQPCDPALSAAWRELATLLDDEIQRLPEAVRTPFVACCLENHSGPDAARLLGMSQSAVAMRVSRARQRLRERLQQRGVSLTAVLAASALGVRDTLATLPERLVASATQAAAWSISGKAIIGTYLSINVAWLAEGVVNAMFLNKLKLGASVALITGLAIAGLLFVGLQALPQPAQAAPQPLEDRDGTVHVTSAQSDEDPAISYVDLQPKANQKLKEQFRESQFQDNNLADVKQGKHTLEGFKFNIGEGMIYLANEKLKDKIPEKVEGIKVGAKFAQLHILHATAYRETPDTVIAKYIVHYADKSEETIEVVYGQDVLDWWRYQGVMEPTRGKVVWAGANEAAKGFEATLWLFAQTWKNPHPNKQVASIDFVSTLTGAAPFVVAMTVEGPAKDGFGVGKDGVRFIKAGKWVHSLAYCNDGKSMAAVVWNGAPRAETEAGAVVLWDLRKGQLEQTIAKFDKDLQFWRLTASKNGKVIAASATHFDKVEYGAIRVWDAATGAALRTFELPAQVDGAIALSSDGKRIAGGGCMTQSGELCVWDVQSGDLLKKLEANGMEYFAVALSEDGKCIAGGGRVRGDAGKVVVWDLETGKVKHEWTDNFMLAITSLAFSPDGKLLAGGGPNNTETRIWDMETGKLKQVLKDHEVMKLAFAPDGTTLATGGTDHKVILWDMANAKARFTFAAPDTSNERKRVIAHAFAPDGRTLAAGDADGTIRFWAVPREK
jgi:RNA polymerase sigma factor (sigma-70 family)